MYFSMDGGDPLVLTINGDGSVNNPTPNASYFDFIEFTVNAPNNPVGNLNIDTTNVDQFGVPITIKVDPTSGSDQTVGAAETRKKIIDAFKTFTSDTNDPYAICLWPTGSGDYGSYRILNPSGLFDEVNPGIQPIQVKTTLQDSISAIDTVISVYCTSAFPDPSVAPFTIQIDSEVMTVTHGVFDPTTQYTNWTVTRGVGATGHNSATPVYQTDPVMTISQTTMTVGANAGFPPSGSFYVLVGEEIIQVSSLKQENLDHTFTYNVARHQFGTTATAHDNGDPVYYSSKRDLALNTTFNVAIDNLFTKYVTTDPHYTGPLQIFSNADGNDRTYSGTVINSGAGTPYYFHFICDQDSSITYDVYYPFFTDNKYFWAGYTPALTPAHSPAEAAGADLNQSSPTEMVFSNNGGFADNSFRKATYPTADQQKVLGDLENQIVAALNRGVALRPGYSVSGANSWKDASLYYENNGDGQVWNRYAQFLHQDSVSIDGLNYGFAFDDQAGQASDIGVSGVDSVTITLAPWATDLNPNPGPGPGPNPDPTPGHGLSQRWFLASTIFPVGSSQSQSFQSQSFSTMSTPDQESSTGDENISAAIFNAGGANDAALMSALAMSDDDDSLGLDDFAGSANNGSTASPVDEALGDEDEEVAVTTTPDSPMHTM